jgi:cell division septation protein DedD
MRGWFFGKETVFFLVFVTLVASVFVLVLNQDSPFLGFVHRTANKLKVSLDSSPFEDYTPGYQTVRKQRKFVHFDHLRRHYVHPNVLGRFKEIRPPDKLLYPVSREIRILPLELTGSDLSVIILPDNQCVFEILQMYLELNAYVPGEKGSKPARRTPEAREASYGFHISPDYSVYPLYPLEADFNSDYWIYQQGDTNRLTIHLDYSPDVLYLMDFNIQYKDLRRGDIKHAESNEFALIRASGEDSERSERVEEWFRDSMRIMPRQARYDECVPFDLYRFLTLNPGGDMEESRFLVYRARSPSNMEKLETVLEQREDNPVFAANAHRLHALLARRSAGASGAETDEPEPEAEKAADSDEASASKEDKEQQEKSQAKEKKGASTESRKETKTASREPEAEEPPEPVPRTAFTFQVASLKSRSNAKDLSQRLRARGYPSRVETATVPGSGKWYRVRIGSFSSRREGLKFASEFRSKEGMNGQVIHTQAW